jgi:hypothetical protein
MLGASTHLLSVWVYTSFSYRRPQMVPNITTILPMLHRRVGHAAATRSHPDGVL